MNSVWLMGKGREQGKLQTTGGLLTWALMDEYKLSRQRIGGREIQAEGTACTKRVLPGVSEKFGVTGAQVYVARTEPGEQGCGLDLGQMLFSFYLRGDWGQEGPEAAD